MKRNIKIIIASLLVLALLAGGYYFLLGWNPENPAEEQASNPPEEQYEKAIDIKTNDVDFVKINNGSIVYTVRNGEKVAIEGYSSLIMDEYQLSMLLYDVTALPVSRKIDSSGKNFSDYGIDENGKSITVATKDGKTEILLIGAPTNFEDEYYAMLKGKDSVFTVSSYSVEKLMKHPSEMRSNAICTLDGQNISAFTIIKNGKKELSIAYDEEYVPANEYQPVSYLITYPYNNVTASLDRLQELFKNISSLAAESIIEENPSDLAKYGLDNPYEVEFISFDEKKVTVKMGNYGENGSIYVMRDNLPVVYLAQCSFYENIKNATAQNYIDRFIHLFNINTVKKISVKAGNKEHLLSIEKNADKSMTYKIDGKTSEESKFKPIYQQIIGITAADFIEEKDEGEENCTISFSLNDGSTKKFTYYIYNDRYCIVKADNNLTCLTLTKNIDTLFEQLK